MSSLRLVFVVLAPLAVAAVATPDAPEKRPPTNYFSSRRPLDTNGSALQLRLPKTTKSAQPTPAGPVIPKC